MMAAMRKQGRVRGCNTTRSTPMFVLVENKTKKQKKQKSVVKRGGNTPKVVDPITVVAGEGAEAQRFTADKRLLVVLSGWIRRLLAPGCSDREPDQGPQGTGVRWLEQATGVLTFPAIEPETMALVLKWVQQEAVNNAHCYDLNQCRVIAESPRVAFQFGIGADQVMALLAAAAFLDMPALRDLCLPMLVHYIDAVPSLLGLPLDCVCRLYTMLSPVTLLSLEASPRHAELPIAGRTMRDVWRQKRAQFGQHVANFTLFEPNWETQHLQVCPTAPPFLPPLESRPVVDGVSQDGCELVELLAANMALGGNANLIRAFEECGHFMQRVCVSRALLITLAEWSVECDSEGEYGDGEDWEYDDCAYGCDERDGKAEAGSSPLCSTSTRVTYAEHVALHDDAGDGHDGHDVNTTPTTASNATLVMALEKLFTLVPNCTTLRVLPCVPVPVVAAVLRAVPPCFPKLRCLLLSRCDLSSLRALVEQTLTALPALQWLDVSYTRLLHVDVSPWKRGVLGQALEAVDLTGVVERGRSLYRLEDRNGPPQREVLLGPLLRCLPPGLRLLNACELDLSLDVLAFESWCELSACPALTHLLLSHNPLGQLWQESAYRTRGANAVAFATLCSALPPTLTHLVVSHCLLSNAAMEAGVEALTERCPSLRHLNVSHNEAIGGSAVRLMAQACAFHWTALHHLDVSRTGFKGVACARSLAHCVQQGWLRGVTSLGLRCLALTDEAADILVDALEVEPMGRASPLRLHVQGNIIVTAVPRIRPYCGVPHDMMAMGTPSPCQTRNPYYGRK